MKRYHDLGFSRLGDCCEKTSVAEAKSYKGDSGETVDVASKLGVMFARREKEVTGSNEQGSRD